MRPSFPDGLEKVFRGNPNLSKEGTVRPAAKHKIRRSILGNHLKPPRACVPAGNVSGAWTRPGDIRCCSFTK